MRPATTALALATLLPCLQGCYVYNPPIYEDDLRMRAINKQRLARDLCISTRVVKLDDGVSDPAGVALAAVTACQSDNNKLIDLLVTMDTDHRPAITEALRKDAMMKATGLVLVQRAVPPKRPKAPGEPVAGHGPGPVAAPPPQPGFESHN
ncbi:MAG TPA: hypothetical protein VMI56_21950 [Reyranella sp.]|nr:hypothetical protein [Reyranella sp.]